MVGLLPGRLTDGSCSYGPPSAPAAPTGLSTADDWPDRVPKHRHRLFGSSGKSVGHGAVPAQVGVDEKAAGKGRDYITMVSDLDAGTVDYIADERRQASLDGYFYRFTPEQLAVTGDKSLAGSKYLWLYSAENLPARHQDRFAALRAGTCRPPAHGPSRKTCATSGPTGAAAGRPSISRAGTSRPPIRGSSRSSTRQRR